MPRSPRCAREAGLPKTLPGFGEVIAAGWPGATGPAPHQRFATASRLACWAAICPGNYRSAKKSKGGRAGGGGACIKPRLIQAAWAAIRVPGRLQARFRRLARKVGGPRNKGAQKRAITAIACHPAQDRLQRPCRPASHPPAWAPASTPAAIPRCQAGLPDPAAPETQPPAASSPSPPRRPPDRADHLTTRPPPPTGAACPRPQHAAAAQPA